jgi:hypothetical protein
MRANEKQTEGDEEKAGGGVASDGVGQQLQPTERVLEDCALLKTWSLIMSWH